MDFILYKYTCQQQPFFLDSIGFSLATMLLYISGKLFIFSEKNMFEVVWHIERFKEKKYRQGQNWNSEIWKKSKKVKSRWSRHCVCHCRYWKNFSPFLLFFKQQFCIFWRKKELMKNGCAQCILYNFCSWYQLSKKRKLCSFQIKMVQSCSSPSKLKLWSCLFMKQCTAWWDACTKK